MVRDAPCDTHERVTLVDMWPETGRKHQLRRHAAETLDENALVSINDLGPIGQSWTRASISYSRGKLYAHTIGKLICIDK